MVKLESTRHWGFSNIRLSALLDVMLWIARHHKLIE